QSGNMAQRLVTAVMTELVIDRLESVQIGHGHADGTALPPTALALTAKQHLVLATVEQSGQRVGGGLALEFLLQQATALDLLLQLPVGPPCLAVHGELAALHRMQLLGSEEAGDHRQRHQYQRSDEYIRAEALGPDR